MENINTRETITISSSDEIMNILTVQRGVREIALVAVASKFPKVNRDSGLLHRRRESVSLSIRLQRNYKELALRPP